MFYVLPIMSNDLHANNFDPLEMLWNLYSSISVLFLCYATMLLSLSLIRCSLSDGVGLSFVMWARWSVRSKTAWEWMLACHPQTTKTTRMSNPVAEYLMYWSGSTTILCRLALPFKMIIRLLHCRIVLIIRTIYYDPPQVKCQLLISSIYYVMNFLHFSEMP